MSDVKNEYTKYQVLATIFIAILIVNLAFWMTCKDKNVYNRLYTSDVGVGKSSIQADEMDVTDGEEIYAEDMLSEVQAEITYSQMVDSFVSFFSGDYELTNYELSDYNVKKLNKIKFHYRKAVIFVILSILGIIYSYLVLVKRRILTPLVHGSVLALVITVIKGIFIMLSDSGIKAGFKAMLLKNDYGYFSSGDVLLRMIPDDYARFMYLLYILWVVGLAAATLLLRKLFIWLGRPHKF